MIVAAHIAPTNSVAALIVLADEQIGDAARARLRSGQIGLTKLGSVSRMRQWKVVEASRAPAGSSSLAESKNAIASQHA
jgi:hypothetical protein